MSAPRVIGTCSLCGGPVQMPTTWYSVVSPLPTCARCGAVSKRGFGPTIEMEPNRYVEIKEPPQ